MNNSVHPAARPPAGGSHAIPGLLVSGSAVLAWLLVVASRPMGSIVADAFPHVHPLVQWVWVPAFALAASWAILAPGLLLVAALGRVQGLNPLVLLGFALSHVLLIAATSAAKLAGVVPFGRRDFLVLLLVLIVGSASAYLLAGRRGRGRAFTRNDVLPAVALASIPVLLSALLLPEIFWQDLNPDGFEAIEIGRALQWVVVPRFPTESGFLGLGIGMVTMAWSNHWWVLLLGPIEAAARLPVALNATAMVAGVVALIEHQRPRMLNGREWMAVLLALGAVVTVLGFNSSYDPYIADLSSPTAFESMTMALLCGMVLTAWRKEWAWFFLFAFLGAMARPSALLVGVLMAVALVLVDRARWRDAARVALLTIGAFAVAFLGYEILAPRLFGGGAGSGYSGEGIIGRFRYLRLFEIHRLAWVMLPAGVVPWLALLLWKRQDVHARQVTLVTVAYALVFLPLAFTNLHQFLPAMVLPVVVYWRLAAAGDARWPWVAAVAGAALSFAFAIPRQRTIDRSIRDLGRVISYRIGSFDQGFAEYREAILSRASVGAILTPWNVPDPATERLGGFQLLYYAMRPKPPGAVPNFVVQPTDSAPPPGMNVLESRQRWTIWVADSVAWHRARYGAFNVRWRRAPYEIPRESMLPYIGISKHAYDVDLRALAGRLVRTVRSPAVSEPPR